MNTNVKSIEVVQAYGGTIDPKYLTDVQLRTLNLVTRVEATRHEIATIEGRSPIAVSGTLRELAAKIVITID